MSSKLPAVTAKNINEAHRLARSCAETAVEHAIRCGQLLAASKEELQHGEFTTWVEQHCEFSVRSARVYMKAAEQNGSALPFSSLRQLEAASRPEVPKQPKPKDSPKGAVSVVKPTADGPRGTEETGDDQPAAPISASEETDADAPEMPSDDELDAIDREIQESEARVLRANDVTTGYHDELKRQAAEIAVLKISRDGYMNGKAAVTKMLEAEQRKTAKLEKEKKKLQEEIEALRERVAIMEAA